MSTSLRVLVAEGSPLYVGTSLTCPEWVRIAIACGFALLDLF